MKAEHVREALRERYAHPAAVIFFEVRDATAWAATGSCDAIAMWLWPSKGLELEGFEIKVTRGDWLRELKQPDKATAFLKRVDRFWLVTPAPRHADLVSRLPARPDVAKLAELPEQWGWLHVHDDGRVVIVKEAPKLSPAPLDRPFLAALLRKAHTTVRNSLLNKLDHLQQAALERSPP